MCCHYTFPFNTNLYINLICIMSYYYGGRDGKLITFHETSIKKTIMIIVHCMILTGRKWSSYWGLRTCHYHLHHHHYRLTSFFPHCGVGRFLSLMALLQAFKVFSIGQSEAGYYKLILYNVIFQISRGLLEGFEPTNC